MICGSCPIDRGRPPSCLRNRVPPSAGRASPYQCAGCLKTRILILEVLSPTRYENRGKVHLVNILGERNFCQAPHPKHLTKSLPSLPKPPGTKTPQKRAWWAGFGPYQVQKPGKSAPGGQVLGPTRYENRPKVRLVVVLKKRGFCQSPHPKHLTNSLPSLPKAPGTKTPQKRAWWAGFRPHQVRNRG